MAAFLQLGLKSVDKAIAKETAKAEAARLAAAQPRAAKLSTTLKQEPQGIDSTAYSQREYNKLGAQVTDENALAAHTARGRHNYASDGGDMMDMSVEQFRKLADMMDSFKKGSMVNDKPMRGDSFFDKIVNDPNPSSKVFRAETMMEERLGRAKMKSFLKNSEIVTDKPIYVMRNEGLMSGQDSIKGKATSIYSAKVVDPNDPRSFGGYDQAGKMPFIHKLPAGSKILHPAGRADLAEIVITKKVLDSSETIATKANYLESLDKGKALFGTGAVVAGVVAGSDTAEATSSEDVELAGKIEGLLAKGRKGADVHAALSTKYDSAKVSELMLMALQPKIAKLRAKGIADEDIMAAFRSAGITLQSLASPKVEQPEQQSLFDTIKNKAISTLAESPLAMVGAAITGGMQLKDKAMTAEPAPDITLEAGAQLSDTIAAVKNFNLLYSDIGNELLSYTGMAPAAAAKHKEAKASAHALLKHTIEQTGQKVDSINEYGEVMIRDEQTGELIAYDESMADSLLASAYELGFGAMGAYGGGVYGAALGTAVAGPAGTLIGGATGAVVGGVAASAAGRGADVYRNAQQLNYTVDMTDLTTKMVDAGVADLTLAALGTSALALAKGTMSGGKAAGRGLQRAYDLFLAGNKEGAQKTLQGVFDLNDARTIELVTQWEKITGNKALTEKARTSGKLAAADADGTLRALTEMVPGAENVVARASDDAKTGGVKLAVEIDKRAKGITKLANDMTNDNVDVVIQDKLGSYVTGTKNFYTDIKATGTELMKDSTYTFNFKDTALVPSLKATAKTINNSMLRKDFYFYLDRIGELSGSSTANPSLRSFENLLELRSTVSQLRGESKFKAFTNVEQLKGALAGIDKEISSAARKHMPEGKTWVKQWKTANVEYHKMKTLESNVLYKALTNPRVTADSAVAAITRSMSYTDPSTFMRVLGKLPDTTRKGVEGAVLKQLVAKHTIGDDAGKQALSFHRLAADLNKVAFTQPEAQALKRTVNEFAKVFKNDGHLLAAVGNVPLPKFQAYLTADPLVRAKFEVASTMFNAVKSRIPFSNNAGRAALVKNLGRLLDNPLDAKTSAQVLAALPTDPTLKTAMHKLAVEFTKRGAPESYGKVPIYKVYKPGTRSSGNTLFYTDKKKAAAIAKQTGGKVKQQMQLHKRIATPEDAMNVVGRELTTKDLSDKEVLQRLQDQDWAGVAIDDKVLLFK